MRRREFITLLGGAIATEVTPVCGQTTMPVLGILYSVAPDGFEGRVRAFRQGLRDSGFIEGQNVIVESRWANNRLDVLPGLADDLVSRNVAAIVALGGPASALAAKAASTSVPIVFAIPDDPVSLGLVRSLARPGGNATGVSFLVGELMQKRFELMRLLLPGLRYVAVLIDGTNLARAEAQVAEVQALGRAMALEIEIFKPATAADIESAFSNLKTRKSQAIFVAPSPFFIGFRTLMAGLEKRHVIPAIYSGRIHVQAGGLASYGTNIDDSYRQAGTYAGRVLKGEKPADLPVMLSTRFELVLNLKTAEALGLRVPDNLLALTDELIE